MTGNSSVRELYEHVQEHGLSDMWSGGVNAAIDIIIAVPPAQPEKRTEERTETHACDLISRQAAMDALEKVAELFPWRVPGNRDSYDRYNEAWNDAIGRAEIEIEKLPSAQPDTDTISRGAAIEAVKNALDPNIVSFIKAKMALEALPPSQLIQPPAQPDRKNIDGYLFNLYRNGLSLIGAESVVSRKHWIKQLYAEIFGEGERPVWMRKDE